jgi:hypothetical protein
MRELQHQLCRGSRAMLVAQPGDRQSVVLVGTGNGDGHATNGRERLRVVGRRKDPQSARATGAADVSGEAGNQIHVSVTREQPGVQSETRLSYAAQPALHLRQGTRHQILEILPVGGRGLGPRWIGARGVCQEHDVPTGTHLWKSGCEKSFQAPPSLVGLLHVPPMVGRISTQFRGCAERMCLRYPEPTIRGESFPDRSVSHRFAAKPEANATGDRAFCVRLSGSVIIPYSSMAWLLFMDESGHDHKQVPYEVRGGFAIQDRRLMATTTAASSAATASSAFTTSSPLGNKKGDNAFEAPNSKSRQVPLGRVSADKDTGSPLGFQKIVCFPRKAGFLPLIPISVGFPTITSGLP